MYEMCLLKYKHCTGVAGSPVLVLVLPGLWREFGETDGWTDRMLLAASEP